MKTVFKNAGMLFWYKFLFTLLSVAFFYSFFWMTSYKNGLLIYSALMCILYFAADYSYIWKAGKKDMRQNKFNIKSVMLSVFISEIPSIILTVLYFVHKTDILTLIYRCYQFVYIGFIEPDAAKIILILPVFFVSALGYALGFKDFEIYDRIVMKLVYKKK